MIREDYPIAHKGEWYSDADYKKTGGRLTHMSPDRYLKRVKPLDIDDSSRDNIEDLKNHIKSGRRLDPLKIYASGKEDGRHRAHAAKELGIKRVPVVQWKQVKEDCGCSHSNNKPLLKTIKRIVNKANKKKKYGKK